MALKSKQVSDRTKRKHWAEEVFERDKHTCQKCGATENLHAHHKIEWEVDKNKRFDLDNGQTLCVDCHKAVHGYGLNDKQKLFCLEYLKDFNATRSYKCVYGEDKSDNVAGASAHNLLRNSKIIEFLKDKREKIVSDKEITVDWVLSGIKSIGDSELAKHNDKLNAYKLGGQYLNLFNDTKSNNTSDEPPVKREYC